MFDSSTETHEALRFHSFASEKHRRFHDRIIAELNGMLPVCNQGKCTAADISDSHTEQQQITDLMQKVEQLCAQLSENVTDLFSQYYQERGRFCGAAYCTTAEIKVNLVDRTLLDRSTDVRWWSKEPVLAEAVSALQKIRGTLAKDIEEMGAYLEGAIASFRIPKLSGDWTSMDITDRVHEVTSYFGSRRELMFHPGTRDAFIGCMEELMEMLKQGENQEGTIKFARRLIKKLRTCEETVASASSQLELIRRTYPSIVDIVLTDFEGVVIATAGMSAQRRLPGSSVGEEAWCKKALTAGGGVTQIERVALGAENKPAIVFANCVRDTDDRQASPIGSIGVFCDFQSEVHELLCNYLPQNEFGESRDGWFSFFTDRQGYVVCANDPDAIPPGSHRDLPRLHRQLGNGEKRWSSLVFNGKESFVFSARSHESRAQGDSGWISHVVAPASDIMHAGARELRLELEETQLLQSKIVPEISKSTYAALQEDRKAIKLISLNGILFASQLGKRGAALAPVFDKITATGDSATSRMEKLLYEMASSEIDLNVRLQEMLAKQAVDLITQKVAERAKSLELWVQTAGFRHHLKEASDESTHDVERLLKLINDDYPAYRNIFLIDGHGDIRACSRPRRLSRQETVCVADQQWFAQAMRAGEEVRPLIAETACAFLDDGSSTSIILAKGIPGERRDGGTLGVLACLFDWKSEAAKILHSCLPKAASGHVVPGSLAVFTNQHQVVLESSEANLAPAGERFELPERHTRLNAGEMTSSQVSFQQQSYVLASAKCEARHTNCELSWCAHVLRPLS